MSMRRILILTVGALVAAGALFLLVRDALGTAASPATSPTTATGPSAVDDPEEKPPRWEDFTNPDSLEPPPRPLALGEIPAESPFERGYGREKLSNLDLRLDGVAPGTPPRAMISGRTLGIGDTIEEFRVLRIDRSGVALEGPAGLRIHLLPGMTFEPPAAAKLPSPPSLPGEEADEAKPARRRLALPKRGGEPKP